MIGVGFGSGVSFGMTLKGEIANKDRIHDHEAAKHATPTPGVTPIGPAPDGNLVQAAQDTLNKAMATSQAQNIRLDKVERILASKVNSQPNYLEATFGALTTLGEDATFRVLKKEGNVVQLSEDGTFFLVEEGGIYDMGFSFYTGTHHIQLCILVQPPHGEAAHNGPCMRTHDWSTVATNYRERLDKGTILRLKVDYKGDSSAVVREAVHNRFRIHKVQE
mmetsp:Transcript_8313/g.20335  ORF Transcript_8313/g.20335 Transcript_8313/m.20335 type:complete len:220 (-) Transcript_8313:506-1165(-)